MLLLVVMMDFCSCFFCFLGCVAWLLAYIATIRTSTELDECKQRHNTQYVQIKVLCSLDWKAREKKHKKQCDVHMCVDSLSHAHVVVVCCCIWI